MTVTHSDIPSSRKRRQLRILGAWQLVFETVARFFWSAAVTRIMGSGLLRELQLLENIAFGGVYVTDPVVPTVLGPKLTA